VKPKKNPYFRGLSHLNSPGIMGLFYVSQGLENPGTSAGSQTV